MSEKIDPKFTSERFKMISDYLKEHTRATVDELSHFLYVSPATVRRDLSEMQKMGMIQRTHGGAVFMDSADEVNIFVRIEKNARDKEKTASLALVHLPEFTSVFIDNSSTCLALAERMEFAYKTVITNGLQIAVKLSTKKDVKVIFLGGTIQYNTYSTDGSLTTEMMNKFHVDLMLCSAAAIRPDGAYEPTMETMQIKREAFLCSDKHILLVDQNKFDITAMYRTQKLSDYDAIYTNADDRKLAAFKDSGAHFINH
ncbi:MAG: DeoR/GlpR family DNA-binding transcription regulator [Bacilli bacterium]|jgi:DeoR/GlpR family transcriptional regulator of sugar metabolism|nr:DeoR/GlpR family DNA-binding transcription regulator [Bacilli bacterium]